MSAETDHTILNDCASWAPMPEWAFGHPEMTPRAFQVFGLLILWSDKITGLTYNVKRSTIADRLRLDSTNSIDAALRVLSKIGCVTVIKNRRPVLDSDGKQTYATDGKPAIWWGPSQYKVTLAQPAGGSHEKITTPQEVATEPCPRWSRNADQGSHENIANNQEPSYKSNSSIVLSDTSQTKVSGEDKVIKEILGGRSLPRELPCERLLFVRMMQQMARDCFSGSELHQVTMTNYNEVKRYCKELAQWLGTHSKPVDPAYLYAFCFYYQGLGHDRHEIPKPISYAKYWDDEDFWDDDFCMERVGEYREAVAKDPTRPPMCHYVWTKAS